ncbi:SIMPL domain-containing protein [Patescibacteria group bacterium]|nr:SIMPL domain-containing protein [Patescibacteria group bacterium]
MENTITKTSVAAAALVGLSLIVSTVIGTMAYSSAKASANTISVTGSAERVITSDTAKWRGGFTRTVPTEQLKEGSAAMQADLRIVLTYLKKQGFTDAEVTVDAVSINPYCPSDPGSYGCDGRVTGYTLQQSLVVESQNVEKVTTLAKEGTNALIGEGLIFVGQNVEYYYSKLADLKLEMLADATGNAKARAQHIADSTDAVLGRIQSASMGVFQVTAVNSTELSDYGAYDTSVKEKKVTAVVRAAFGLR